MGYRNGSLETAVPQYSLSLYHNEFPGEEVFTFARKLEKIFLIVSSEEIGTSILMEFFPPELNVRLMNF